MEQRESVCTEVDGLLDLLLSQPEDAALALLATTKDDNTCASGEKEELQNKLRAVCSELFRRIEALNSLQGSLAGRNGVPTLSGLAELYVGGSQDGEEPVDAETIFGQVELMNQSLTSKVKKSIKQVRTSLEMGEPVRLLDDEDVSGSEDSADEENMTDEGHSSPESDNQPEDEEIDEERKRIEARMSRAMEDMEEDESDLEENNDASLSRKQLSKSSETVDSDESLEDPAAGELNDGFFDINEMEQFADEEEEYLPDEAFGEEKREDDAEEDKRSFHQKQREGDLDDNDEEESDEEESDLIFKKESSVRRKRYRDEEEIDALYELYQGVDEDEQGSDDSAKDAVNMTAADLYGQPNKKYFEKWKARAKKTHKSDDDSWDDYDFSIKGKGDTGGWNDRTGEDDGGSSSDSEVDGNESSPPKPGPLATETKESETTKPDKLQRQTEDLEREMLAEKPWQMKGETSGTARPFESLLDSTPEFELATKQAPIITVERTMSLEEIIKKRILNEDWDDVVPRELPDVAWNKKQGDLPEVSQEKSKLGLGELYEREYMKKALGYDADAAEKESEEEKVKSEIRSLFANLCSKLDALSNYHFAPRPIADEAEIRPVTQPAIAMEEVLPLHVSEARGVAPEEVYGAKRGRDGVLRGDTELEQQDRKRLRSAKKAARRKARKEKLADEKLISRLQPGLGLNNPYERRKMREELSVARAQGKITTGETDRNKYGSSGTFFQRMQQEAQQSIKGNAPAAAPETGKRPNKSSVVKL